MRTFQSADVFPFPLDWRVPDEKRRRAKKQPRRPQPFFREFTQSYYLELDGRQISLGPDEQAAWDEYHRIMAAREFMTCPTLPVWKLFEAYLEEVSRDIGQ